MDDKAWNHSTIFKNRERLMQFEVTTALPCDKEFGRAGRSDVKVPLYSRLYPGRSLGLDEKRPKDDQDQDSPAAGGPILMLIS